MLRLLLRAVNFTCVMNNTCDTESFTDVKASRKYWWYSKWQTKMV